MYLIEILHQTTTCRRFHNQIVLLYLIEILHQTTTRTFTAVILRGCILSKFYIKPQLDHPSVGHCFVVSYRNSTSNHNWKSFIVCNLVLYLIEILHQTTTIACTMKFGRLLYLIEILHQTTTHRGRDAARRRCILSKFYIKPQQCSYCLVSFEGCILSKFYIKPQHCLVIYFVCAGCILSKFYIKPQRQGSRLRPQRSCILSKFYIKPQLRLERELARCVVSYRNSTSNHNTGGGNARGCTVVSYRNSTSNHNLLLGRCRRSCVVSYRNSTSNHNGLQHVCIRVQLYLIEILHQTTTTAARSVLLSLLYLIEILHQTTTLP